MISKLFKPRYKIDRIDEEWLCISVKRFPLGWSRIGVSRNVEQAMKVIKAHRDPVKPVKTKPVKVYEE